jgi:hypothetical protein
VITTTLNRNNNNFHFLLIMDNNPLALVFFSNHSIIEKERIKIVKRFSLSLSRSFYTANRTGEEHFQDLSDWHRERKLAKRQIYSFLLKKKRNSCTIIMKDQIATCNFFFSLIRDFFILWSYILVSLQFNWIDLSIKFVPVIDYGSARISNMYLTEKYLYIYFVTK